MKLHKPSTPLRPVVGTRGTATYATLVIVGCSVRTLRNTIDLVDKLNDVVLRDDEMLVSYDVKSSFTSIPVEESIQVCEKRLIVDKTLSGRTQLDIPTIIQLLRFCLTSTAFQYRGQHYKQLDGVTMGSPVSPNIADLSMEDPEDKTFATYDATPCVWYRFVDDVISVVKNTTSKDYFNT